MEYKKCVNENESWDKKYIVKNVEQIDLTSASVSEREYNIKSAIL